MRRGINTLIATLLVLVLASANISSVPPSDPGGDDRFEDSALPADPVTSQGETIHIYFHGLMVGRFGSRNRRFEVGIPKDIPGHTFALQVVEGRRVKQIRDIEKKVYEFEVVNVKMGREEDSAVVAEPYEPQASFDRQSETAATPGSNTSRDYRYVPDMEGYGLHEAKIDRKSKPFKHAFHVLEGSVKSKCITLDSLSNKTLVSEPYDWKRYGYIAEIVGVDITLSSNQKLVLRERKDHTKQLWVCSYSPKKTVEARVLNLPHAASHPGHGDYIAKVCEPSSKPDPCTSHFQYYYIRLFDIKAEHRYELKSDRKALIKLYAHKYRLARAQGYEPRAIFPYMCGMVRQSQTGDDIDEDDIE